MKYLSIFLAIFPSFIHVNVRRILGQRIGKKSKISIGTIIISGNINIGENVNIGPFTYMKGEKITIGNNSVIKSLSVISSRKIKLGKYVHIAPLAMITSEFTENSFIEIGDHSRIFPYSWLDTGEGITIGKNVGVGGHSLIFTHGVWSNYIDGGPVTYGPVTIQDNVWLPWRVFILPNVTIGKNTIVGGNSLVNKSLGENVIAAGTPAKIVKEISTDKISEEEKTKRALYVLEKFSAYINFKLKIASKISENSLICGDFKIAIDDEKGLNKGDLLLLVNRKMELEELKNMHSKKISVLNHNDKNIKIARQNKICDQFIIFLRRFGVRLDIG